MVPPATAVVNGERRGSKKRTYGSSEVSAKRTVSSASISAVSAMRPEPETTRRGEAASISQREQLAAKRQPAVQLADAFVAGEQVVDAELDVVARLVERAARRSRELEQARRAAPAGTVAVFSDSTGIRAPSALNE